MTIKNSLCLSHELQINDFCISLCERLKSKSISVFTKLVCNFHTFSNMLTFQCFALPPVLDKFTLHQVMTITFNDALTISILNNCLGVLPLSGTAAAAAAAKSLQSCPTLCDPIDGSPRGSPIPEIL